MTLLIKDRIKETAPAPGTSPFALAGAVTGFQAFSAAIGNGNSVYYTAWDGAGAWETGIGAYTSSGNTLARTSVLASSTGSPISFTNAVTVWGDAPASKLLLLDANGLAALPNGSTATTQSGGDNSTKVATTAYADANAATIGSWTPTLGGSGGGFATLSVAVGSYVKTPMPGGGFWYTANGIISCSASNSFTGNAQIGGLPWTQKNTANDAGIGSINYCNGLGVAGGVALVGLQISPNTNVAAFLQSGFGAAGTTLNMTAANFAAVNPTIVSFQLSGHT